MSELLAWTENTVPEKASSTIGERSFFYAFRFIFHKRLLLIIFYSF